MKQINMKQIKRKIFNYIFEYIINIFLKKSISLVSLVLFILICNLDIININFFFIDSIIG